MPVAPGPTFAPAPHSRGPRAAAAAEPRTAAIIRVAVRAAEALP